MELNNITVEILNPDLVRNIYKNHGQFACVCYNTDEKYSDKVGNACFDNGHMSGSRCEYIKFKITGIDRGTAEQVMRHEIGTDVPYPMMDNYSFSDLSNMIIDVPQDEIVKNMASFRYIDKTDFKYSVPASIEQCESANRLYYELMSTINKYRQLIKYELVESGISEKRAVQDSNFVLPRATESSLVIGFTPEALIHFCHKRLCVRSQEFIRDLAHKMKFEVSLLNKKLADELVPHCEYLLWCPEGTSGCGRKPTRVELLDRISPD